MKHSNFILLYWRKEQKVFNKNFEILSQRQDENAIHDLRVAIKKLRACLKLYAIVTGKKDLIAIGWQNFFTQTKILFNVLGKERDVEICIEFLINEKKETGTDYINIKIYLQSMLQTMQVWSQNAIKNYDKKELANLALVLSQGAETLTKEWLIKKTIDAINDNLQHIKNYFKQPHKIRKLLKDVYYWLKMLPKNAVSDKSLEKELEKILDDFGNWQNDEILLTKTNHYRQDNLPDSFSEYHLLKSLEKEIDERKGKLLKDMLYKVRRLPKKVSMAG